MSIVVTGASGHFGRLVIESLLVRGVAPEQIVAGTRTVDALSSLAERGVQVRRIDFDDAASLTAGFAGVDKALIVSGTEVGRRVEQHVAAARAAKTAGASLIVYTSAPRADSTNMQLAADHTGTEEGIAALGVPFTFLRNNWYFENYTAQIPTYLQFGAVVGSAGDGRISGAARADYAEAAAAVLTGVGHENKVYELAGDTSFSLTELAEQIAKYTGRPITYRNLPQAELETILTGAGVPGPMAAILADVDRAISEGLLEADTHDLSHLIGRPTTPLSDAVKSAVAALPSA